MLNLKAYKFDYIILFDIFNDFWDIMKRSFCKKVC